MFPSNAIDKSLERSTDDMSLFTGPVLPYYDPSDKSMGFWANLVTGLVQAGGQVYGAKSAKAVTKAQIAHEGRMATMQEDTRRMELALQAKQAELLASASQKGSGMLGGVSKTIQSPAGMVTVAGASIGLGLLLFLLLRKKKRR